MINKTFSDWYVSKKITQKTTIIGNTGYGKSVAGMAIQRKNNLNKWPYGVIDLKGIHYAVRAEFDEVVIIGGPRQDVSLEKIDEVFESIMDNGLNWIIDLSEFDNITAQETVTEIFKFLRDWHVTNRKPRNYIIEECDIVIGQTGTMSECKRIINQCINKERMNGMGFTLISQRFRMIDKDALGPTDNYIVFNVKQTLDLALIKKLMGEDVSMILRRLPIGKCLIMTEEGHATYKVVKPDWPDTSATPEIGVTLPEIEIKELNPEVKKLLRLK